MKKIIIVYPFPVVDSVPCLVSLATMLPEHGYQVDILTTFNEIFIPPSFVNQHIKVIRLYSPRTSWPAVLRFLPGRVYYTLSLAYRYLITDWKIPCACIIGVDPDGLILAQSMRKLIKSPLAYFSLEMIISYEQTKPMAQAFKQKEIDLSHKAAFVVALGEERRLFLAKDNQLDPKKVISVPNAPRGPARNRHSSYLRQKFNLTDDKRIILYAGSLRGWACLHQLMDSTKEWPEEWVLVCHSSARSLAEIDYYLALQYLAHSERVIFSTEPIPHVEYLEMVQSADIGVAFYMIRPGGRSSQDNLTLLMGLSSGKTATYLWAGKPVLTNNITSLQNLIRDNQCGEVVENPSQTFPAIQRILANYEVYSANAITCFNQLLDFENHFGRILNAIASVSS
jgi:glycosyltransferase involved in cell wall biosynthesis